MLTQISTWMKEFTSQNADIAEDEIKLAARSLRFW